MGRRQTVKRYRVTLSIRVTSFVHATHYEQVGTSTRFYRGEILVAEYATASLLKIEEVRRLDDPPSTKGGRSRVRL
jgi:hypothetical protein